LQRFALDRVKFLGITGEEAKGRDERRIKISALVDQLASLKKAS